MKKYLVLGSSGQIGSYLVSYLRDRGHYVYEFSRTNDPDQDLRINNNKILNQYMQECDFVFFLAFDVGGSRYLRTKQDTFHYFHNNVQIMSNTFELLERHKKPFLFTSTSISHRLDFPYAFCKTIGEKYTYYLDGLMAKLWNVYGPEISSERSHVTTDFIEQIKNNGKIEMMTDGLEYRQFLYVEDCCDALLTLSDQYDTLNRSKEYHVARFEWNTVLDIAEEISKNFNDAEIIPGKEQDLFKSDVLDHPDPYILQYWKPKISLSDGILKIINTYG